MILQPASQAHAHANYVGVDPGASTGIAVLHRDADGEPFLAVGHVSFKYGVSDWAAYVARFCAQPHTLVVEQQAIYPGTGNPASIINLAQVAGALLHGLCTTLSPQRIYTPQASEWRGGVSAKKPIEQARLCAALGWPAESTKGYTAPIGFPTTGVRCGVLPGFDEPRKVHWAEIMDAIGMAIWSETVGKTESLRT